MATWPIERARHHFLQTVRRLAPEVLADLATVAETLTWSHVRPGDDRMALERWARRYGLDAPWLIIVARNTIGYWSSCPAALAKDWDYDQEDTGELVPQRGRYPNRAPELLIRPEHFEWTVKRRVLKQGFKEITSAATESTARKAVHKLERVLGFTDPQK